jgi:hypothetical protein
VFSHIQCDEHIGWGVCEAFGPVQRDAELVAETFLRRQAHCFRQVPQQLVQLSHNAQDVEYWLCDPRGPAPVLSAEGDLGNFLPCAETIEHRAARKPALPQMGVDIASEVRLQVWAGLARRFVDSKFRGLGKRGRDTAQANTVFTIRSEVRRPHHGRASVCFPNGRLPLAVRR